MFRTTIIASLCLFLAASFSFAADAPTYGLNATATATADVLTVTIELTSTAESTTDLPPGVKGPLLTTQSQKAIIKLKRGQLAIMVLGDANPKGEIALGNSGAKPPVSVDSITDGIKVEVISVKDQNTVVVVGTRLKDSQVIWAQAKLIESTPGTQPAK